MHPSSYGRSVLAPASLAGVDPIFTSLNLRTILSPATHAPNTIALIRHLSVMPFLVGLGFALPQQARQTHRPNRVPCVRTGLPPRAALHPALRRRSCIWLQARDVGLEGLTPSGCVRSMAHWGGLPWPPGTVCCTRSHCGSCRAPWFPRPSSRRCFHQAEAWWPPHQRRNGLPGVSEAASTRDAHATRGGGHRPSGRWKSAAPKT